MSTQNVSAVISRGNMTPYIIILALYGILLSVMICALTEAVKLTVTFYPPRHNAERWTDLTLSILLVSCLSLVIIGIVIILFNLLLK